MKSTHTIAIYGLLTALIIVLTFTVGYIPLGFANPTIIHIPVIIGVLYGTSLNKKNGLYSGLYFGAIFGLSSFINKLIASPGMFTTMFLNPLVSIIPRIIVGLFCYFLCRRMSFIKNRKIRVSIIGGLTTLANTFLVFTSIVLLYSNFVAEEYGNSVWVFIGANIVVSSIAEIVVSIVLTPVVYFSLIKASLIKKIEN